MWFLGWLVDDWRWSYELTSDLGRRPAPRDIRPCCIELAVVLVCIGALLALAFARDQKVGIVAHRLLPSLSSMMLMAVAMPFLFVISILYDASLDPPFQSLGEVMGHLCASGELSVANALVFGLEVVMLAVLATASWGMVPNASVKTHALNLAGILATSLLFSPPIFAFVDIVIKDSQGMVKAMGIFLVPGIYLVLACVATISRGTKRQAEAQPPE